MITFNELLKLAETKRVAIHTITEEQAITLLSELDKKGCMWSGTARLITGTFYGEYKENTCYSLHEHYKIPSIKKVMHGPLNHYQERGYTIIECGDIEEMKNNITRKNMTNREWLFNKMQNMSDEEFEEIVIIDCTYWEPLYKKCGSKSCSNCQREWLLSLFVS